MAKPRKTKQNREGDTTRLTGHLQGGSGLKEGLDGKAYMSSGCAGIQSSPQMQETLLHVYSSGKMHLCAPHILKRSKQKSVMQVIHH